jgi:hypothetical protein
LSFKTHSQIFLLAIFFSGLAYFAFGWEGAIKSSIVYLPLWAGAEFLHWVKMRQSTKCLACGFDPILYQKDWRKAREQVETKLRTVVDSILNQQIAEERARLKKLRENAATASKNKKNSNPETRP